MLLLELANKSNILVSNKIQIYNKSKYLANKQKCCLIPFGQIFVWQDWNKLACVMQVPEDKLLTLCYETVYIKLQTGWNFLNESNILLVTSLLI